MLRSLSIRNFAIIDRLDLEFEPGLNVLTGETGAGKSIIMGALNVILGGRAGIEMVRSGTERASVDAAFDLSASPETLSEMIEAGFETDDGMLVVSREVTSGGKSTVRIAGRPATVAQLREIGDWLVDLHGQHEHQSLLSVPRHLDILDDWGGKEILTIRGRVGEAFRCLRTLEAEREALLTDSRERARLLDLYRFQVDEIMNAGLTDGEEDALKADSRRLANALKLSEAAETAVSGLAADGAILEMLRGIMRSLGDSTELDEALAPIAESVSGAAFVLEEAARDLSRYQDSIEHDPERLQQMEERLDLIANLKRKYGDTVEEVIAFGRQTADELEGLVHSDERAGELDIEIAEACEILTSLGEDLSNRRKRVGIQFADSVLTELKELAMERTRFEVQIERGEPTPKGIDRVEYLIAPNPGEPLRPLARIASGGEISRVMLAIKSAMARQDPLPTMVFDEIDAGVGGRTASVLGDKLANLSHSAQILCITHLPQIASRGNAHYFIQKQVIEDRTSVTVTPLRNGSRVEELARMLGGADVTETVLQHAREMLKTA